jgi:RNA-binding protein
MSDAVTNPRKRSLMPSSPLRRRLRALGHPLSAVVQVGKDGVTPGVGQQATHALHDHELIKVKIGSECPQDRFEVAASLGELPGVNVVQVLGRVVLLYKRHPQKPKIEGGKAAVKSATRPAPERRRRPAPGRAPARARRG